MGDIKLNKILYFYEIQPNFRGVRKGWSRQGFIVDEGFNYSYLEQNNKITSNIEPMLVYWFTAVSSVKPFDLNVGAIMWGQTS